MIVQFKAKPTPPLIIERWSNKDFLFYFSQKLEEMTGVGLDIPPVAWSGFLGRMKGFRDKLIISNIKYKEFIDCVFKNFFSRDSYTPSFGAIVSEKVYNIVLKELKKPTPFSNSDFQKLRDILYQNFSLM